MTTPRLIATAFALVAFAGALFVGLRAGNPIVTILTRSLTIMVGCYVVGRLAGVFADQMLRSQLTTYRTNHPLGGDAEAGPANDAPAAERPTDRLAA